MPVCTPPPLTRLDIADALDPYVPVDYVMLSNILIGLVCFVFGLAVGIALVLVMGDRNP